MIRLDCNCGETTQLNYETRKRIALRILVHNEVTAHDIAEIYDGADKTTTDLVHDFLNFTKLSPISIAIIALKLNLDQRKRIILARGMLHL